MSKQKHSHTFNISVPITVSVWDTVLDENQLKARIYHEVRNMRDGRYPPGTEFMVEGLRMLVARVAGEGTKTYTYLNDDATYFLKRDYET